MVSGVFPALYVLMQALVETLPTVPEMTLNTELPLSAFDGISRAYLLCNLVTPVVLTNPRPEVAASPWALLVASLVRHSSSLPIVLFYCTDHDSVWSHR